MSKKRTNIVKNKAKFAPTGKKVDKYDVFVTVTGKQIAIIKGKVIIYVSIDNEHIEISGKNGTSFIFRSENKKETVARWDDVVKCLSLAIKEVKKERKL